MIQPRTTPRKRLYSHYVTAHMGEESAGSVWLRRYVLTRLPARRSARILDSGCGGGDLVALLQAQGYAEAEGVDTSPEQVALAVSRGVPGVHEADLMDYLQDRREEYDAIVALDLLEHFDRAELLALLDAMRAALRPGGTLLARTPNAGSPFFGRYQFGDLTHETGFTVQSMKQALEVTGFEIVEAVPSNPVPHGAVSALRFLCWQVVAATIKACLFIETGQLRGHIVTQNLFVEARTPTVSKPAVGSSS